MVAHDLAREHRVQVPLQRRQLQCDVLDQRVGHDADFAVLERARRTVVAPAAEAVHAEQLSAHEEAGNLLAALAVDQAGLEEAAANGIQHPELVAGGEQRLAALDAPPRVDDFLDAMHVVEADAAWQAQLPQVTGGAADLELAGRGFGPLHEHDFRGGFECNHGRHIGFPSVHGHAAARWAIRSRTRSNSLLLSKKSRAPSRSARRRYGS